MVETIHQAHRQPTVLRQDEEEAAATATIHPPHLEVDTVQIEAMVPTEEATVLLIEEDMVPAIEGGTEAWTEEDTAPWIGEVILDLTEVDTVQWIEEGTEHRHPWLQACLPHLVEEDHHLELCVMSYGRTRQRRY